MVIELNTKKNYTMLNYLEKTFNSIKCILVFLLTSFSNPVLSMNNAYHNPESFVQAVKNDPLAGKKIYDQFCATCHALHPAIEVGAPHKGIKSDWMPRLKKGIDGLLVVTILGINQMPPRGGCFECSDPLLRATILYMIPNNS